VADDGDAAGIVEASKASLADRADLIGRQFLCGDGFAGHLLAHSRRNEQDGDERFRREKVVQRVSVKRDAAADVCHQVNENREKQVSTGAQI
jgi:hypothetical protein